MRRRKYRLKNIGWRVIWLQKDFCKRGDLCLIRSLEIFQKRVASQETSGKNLEGVLILLKLFLRMSFRYLYIQHF